MNSKQRIGWVLGAITVGCGLFGGAHAAGEGKTQSRGYQSSITITGLLVHRDALGFLDFDASRERAGDF
jgi:hypothetical protein